MAETGTPDILLMQYAHDTLRSNDEIAASISGAAGLITELAAIKGTHIEIMPGTGEHIVQTAQELHEQIERHGGQAELAEANPNLVFPSSRTPQPHRYSNGDYDALKLGDIIAEDRNRLPVVITNNPFIEDIFIFGNFHGVLAQRAEHRVNPAFTGFGEVYGLTLKQCDEIAIKTGLKSAIQAALNHPHYFEDPQATYRRLQEIVAAGTVAR